MERKSIVIDIPDGMCIDESNSTFEKIVFKKKDTKPRSWEEYCDNFSGELFYFSNRNSIESVVTNDGMSYTAKDCLPSKELARTFIAMMQLMSLRQAWIGDWKPDWNDSSTKWCIIYGYGGVYIICPYTNMIRTLSFPNREMAEEFLNCFKDLLETAKSLI